MGACTWACAQACARACGSSAEVPRADPIAELGEGQQSHGTVKRLKYAGLVCMLKEPPFHN